VAEKVFLELTTDVKTELKSKNGFCFFLTSCDVV